MLASAAWSLSRLKGEAPRSIEADSVECRWLGDDDIDLQAGFGVDDVELLVRLHRLRGCLGAHVEMFLRKCL
jgi:hypothetical protein